MSGLAVRTAGLTRRFGRRWALRGVDLEVPRGEMCALLGANGTGKTTLLRVLATLLRPTAGTVEVLGRAIEIGGDEVRRRAGLMTPAGHTYEELTGVENLRFAARMAGSPADGDRLRAGLAAVGLADAAEEPARAYSSGMRKRLELARMRLRQLELVLLDEPFTSLDDAGVGLVQDAVAAWKASGATVLLASHRVDDALRHADRVVRLERGRVVSDDAG